MKLQIANDDFEIHETPLEIITIKDNSLLIEFDDVNEEKYQIKFVPYQGFKLTTIDCFNYDDYTKFPYLMEQTESLWVKKLHSSLKENDPYANFMDKAHHYMLFFQSSVVEIIAWDTYKIKKL